MDNPWFEPRQEQKFFTINGSEAHPAYCSPGTGVLILGVKRPGHDIYHSPPSNTEFKNEYGYTTSTSPHTPS